ncbi:MAG: DUF6017 domain-containing protein [Eubacterium sp.]
MTDSVTMTRGEMMKFDFYYGEESEQYSFYSVPKMFFTCERFAGLSAMSKLLYGFLLDRMSLSRKRNWIDDKNRAYIKYSLNAITKDMGVSKNSVIKYMRELQEFGLIMKYPNEGMEDIIYVMDYSRVKQGDTYSSDDKQNDNVLYLDSQSSVAAYKADTGHPDNAPPGFNTVIALSNINNTKKIQDAGCKGDSTLRGGSKSEPVQNLHHPHKENDNNIYNNINNQSTKTDKIDRYIYNNPSINQSNLSISHTGKIDRIDKTGKEKQISGANANTVYAHIRDLVKKNIDYDIMIERQECKDWYDEYYNLIVEVLTRQKDTIRISGEDYSADMVRERFMKLNGLDLQYVHEQMSRTTSDIKNIKAYLTKALFNAPTTRASYWESRVNHDLANR